MTKARFCTKCGCFTTDMNWTAVGMLVCTSCHESMLLEACNRRPDEAPANSESGLLETCQRIGYEIGYGEAAAKADIAAEQSAAKVPANIVAGSMRAANSLEVQRAFSDSIGQAMLKAWEEGFHAAVRIAEHEGAIATAETLRKALADYWRTQGIEDDG